MKRFYSVLRFFRLLGDRNNHLSLTNISLWICIIQLLRVTNPGITEIGALLLSLAAYNVKRVVTAKAVKDAAKVEAEKPATPDNVALEQRLQSMEGILSNVKDKVAAMNLGNILSGNKK